MTLEMRRKLVPANEGASTLTPKRSAGLQPALDIQASRMVAIKGTLVQRACGCKPVRDRRSGAVPRCVLANDGCMEMYGQPTGNVVKLLITF